MEVRMRRILVFNWVSIDGYFAGPNGEIDWIIRDPEVDQALRKSGNDNPGSASMGSDTMLLGNITYTMFENSWPNIAKDPNAPDEMRKMAEEVERMTKIVFSQSRDEVTWKNTKLLHDNLLDEVEQLKQGVGSPILIFGSGTIVQQLTDASLIDDYFIAVTPVVLGRGKPLFGDVQKRTLRLLAVQQFTSGNVLLRYEVDQSLKDK
jgi:dihydrofolate reductase